MSLAIHLSLHFLFAVLAGLITWLFFGHPFLSLTAAFLGGVMIDLDHLIDYFIAFGPRFQLNSFLKGHQFIKNDKIYVLFHGWEYVILSIITIVILGGSTKINAIVWGLTLGSFFHLVTDRYVNHGMTLRGYSLFYRAWHGFKMKDIVTPEHYAEHLIKYKNLFFK